MKELLFNSVRIQLFNENILRIEEAVNGKFCDKNTLFVPERASLEGDISITKEENTIKFGEYVLQFENKKIEIENIILLKNGEVVYRYKPLENSGELPPIEETPDVFALADNPRIILPNAGYTASAKEDYSIQQNVKDIYLLLCEKDAVKLRSLYVQLTGKSEMPPLSVLGIWNSKYYKYNEDSAKKVITDYQEHNIPLDNLVIDTDWRVASDTGIGYDINTTLFPDLKRFMDYAHNQHVQIMFNDHPEPVEEAEHAFDKKEIAYREEKLQSILKHGLDIWWYDRNWRTKLKTPCAGVTAETIGLYLFSEITRHYRQKTENNNKVYRRPTVMGNVDNIHNGFYSDISTSASHRYGIQWTGDIMCDKNSIAMEIFNIIKGGDNCIAYVNSDCGGHVADIDKELFIRWMQYGTLSPIFRPHCSNTVKRTREPWLYDEETLNIVRKYILLRYRLLPTIYQNAFETYSKGLPIFKRLGWNYLEDKIALQCESEYMLGKNLLISPIIGNKIGLVKKENYVKKVSATFYNGRNAEGEVLAKTTYDTLSMRCSFNSPLPNVPVFDFSAIFETAVTFKEPVKLIIRCDDGATVWIDGNKVLQDDTMHGSTNFDLMELEANKVYNIKVKYFQAGGEAECSLYAVKLQEQGNDKVYLPNGKWLNPFNGKTYKGNTYVPNNCKLEEFPLFIRKGAILPLAYEAKNTYEQKWDTLVYDFYPDKEATDNSYLYEDDTLTTAYQQGKYRLSSYEAKYSQKCNAYVVNFHASKGKFQGEKAFEEREISIKCHLLDNETIKKVTINNEEIPFELVKKDETIFPLSTTKNTCDSDTIFFYFKQDIHKEYEIKFFLE